MFTSKEKVLEYLISGYIHLSKKDFSFFNNISHAIKSKKPITSNQTLLFDKLLIKYKRQLHKNGHKVDNLLLAEWQTEVIQSKDEYLIPYVYLEQDYIYIKSPFNTKFVGSIRKEPLCNFEWNKVDKVYKVKFSTYALKTSLELVTKHYDTIRTCDTINELLSSVKKYQALYWSPTLVKSQGVFYISCINDILYQHIKDLELSDNPKILFELSKYGINIDKKITLNNNYLEFASNRKAVVNIEDLPQMVNWLVDMGVNHVILSRDLVYNKKLSKEVRDLLQNKLSNGTDLYSDNSLSTVSIGLSSNHILREKNISFAKVITISNTRPITVL